MYISTLRSYIEAMGGELEVVARFPDGNVKISNFSDIEALPLRNYQFELKAALQHHEFKK